MAETPERDEEKRDKDPEPFEGTVSPEVTEGKFFAAIGYFSFLCFVPLLLKKDNRFAMFHGKQGLILFILELAACVASVIPVLGPIIGWLGFVAFVSLSLVGIYKVITEEEWKMPYIYELSEKIEL